MLGSRGRAICTGLGLVLLGVADFLPTAWYDELPRPGQDLSEAPIRGVTLVGVAFAAEGACLLFIALRGGIRVRLGTGERLRLAEPGAAGTGDLRRPLIWVLGATALGAVLRLYNLGSDLWLDEIATILAYRDVSAFHVLADYTSANNHLLNTLLIKLMVGLAGPAEWAVRLPAVVFGIAGIPALYGLSRLALGRGESVLVAFLVAISYHHVFFSQNARGYTGLLLWSLLGTTAFLRGLSGGGVHDWALYVLSMFLSAATVLHGIFVVVGHVMMVPVVCWMLRRQGKSFLPFLRTVTAVFAILGLMLFHLYASVIPQVYVYLHGVYRTEAVGYSIWSGELLEEFFRGLAAGFGGVAAVGAVAAMAIVCPGFVAFFRRHTVYCLTLIAPLLATFAFLAAFDLRVAPRFFLWALPVALIFAVGTFVVLHRIASSSPTIAAHPLRWVVVRAPWVGAGLLLLLSLFSLPHYYSVPKQPSRQSVEWLLANRQPNDVIVTAWLARWGLRFYGPPLGLEEGKGFLVVESSGELRSIEEQTRGRTLWLLMTFPRALKLEYPDLDAYIRERYRLRKSFPATIGDAEITVWER